MSAINLENEVDLIYRLLSKRYEADTLTRSWLTEKYPWFDGTVTQWIQRGLIVPLLLLILMNSIQKPLARLCFTLTNWSVVLTTVYIILSL